MKLDPLDHNRLKVHVDALVEAAIEMASTPDDIAARHRFDDARKWLDRVVEEFKPDDPA